MKNFEIYLKLILKTYLKDEKLELSNNNNKIRNFFLTFIMYYLIKENFNKDFRKKIFKFIVPIPSKRYISNDEIDIKNYSRFLSIIFKDDEIYEKTKLEDFINVMVKNKICDKNILSSKEFTKIIEDNLLESIRGELPKIVDDYDIADWVKRSKNINNTKEKTNTDNFITFSGGFTYFHNDFFILQRKGAGTEKYIEYFILNNFLSEREKELIAEKYLLKCKDVESPYDLDPALFLLHRKNTNTKHVTRARTDLYINNNLNCLPEKENKIYIHTDGNHNPEIFNISFLENFFPNEIKTIKSKMKLIEGKNNYKFNNNQLKNEILHKKFKEYGLEYKSTIQKQENYLQM